MKVYQASDGSWIFFDGETKHTELTKTEAYAMSDKLTKAQAVQNLVTELAGIDDLLDVINAREYGQGQTNAIADDDVASLNVTASDIFNALNLLTQIKTLITNGTPAQADYTGVVNKVRSDV
jgi:hypothetical protein